MSAALGVSFEIGPGDGIAVHPISRPAPTMGALRGQREQILQAAAAEGATNVRVFGSVARGDATPDSDVDLVVDFEPGCSLSNMSGLQLVLESLLKRRVHVTTLPHRPSSDREARVIDRIVHEALPL